MRTFVVLALVLCLAVPVAHGEEKGAFDDWFGMAEMQAGTLWNFETDTWEPFLSAPLVGWKEVRLVVGAEIDVDEGTEAKGMVAGHVALTYNLGTLADMGVDVPLAEYVGLNIGPSWRFDIETGESALCVMATIVDVSFGQGNVEKHKNR